MHVNYLDSLDRAVNRLLMQRHLHQSIARLRTDLQSSPEPFVWSTVDCEALRDLLPPEIQSAWIFVLRTDVWSGAHFHPNSVQHMVLVEGGGRARIAGDEARIIPFGARGKSSSEVWQVIGKGIPHEFLPEGGDMVVISFHTCSPDDLIEIEAGTGHSRHYELKTGAA